MVVSSVFAASSFAFHKRIKIVSLSRLAPTIHDTERTVGVKCTHKMSLSMSQRFKSYGWAFLAWFALKLPTVHRSLKILSYLKKSHTTAITVSFREKRARFDLFEISKLRHE